MKYSQWKGTFTHDLICNTKLMIFKLRIISILTYSHNPSLLFSLIECINAAVVVILLIAGVFLAS